MNTYVLLSGPSADQPVVIAGSPANADASYVSNDLGTLAQPVSNQVIEMNGHHVVHEEQPV